MKRHLLTLSAIALLGALALMMIGTDRSTEAAGTPQTISVFGAVPGTNLAVHITAVVPQGRRAQDVAAEVLAAQGARPFDSADYSLTGLDWDRDNDPSTAAVVEQHYNGANDPTGGGYAALQATQIAWSGVTDDFSLSDGRSTNRCPSLVQECDGPQVTDGNNDVAWLVISDKNTLGVTWFTTSGAPEADMALNTAFRWTVEETAAGREGGCKGPSRKCYVFDAQTVFVHENGHVAGLGHSSVEGAVMEPAYEEVRRVLHQDDINGLTALYPSDTAPPPPAPGGTASVASVTHSTSGGRSGDKHLSVAVAVVDGDAKPVSGASVSVLLDLLDSPRAWSGTGTTGGDGTVTFTLSNAPSGCYTTTVTDVSADGLTWDNSDGQPNGFCK